ncbi:MAG TPA: DUF5947 family protein [Rugosimonospora sp.]
MTGLAGLRRYARPDAAARARAIARGAGGDAGAARERCEMCDEALGDRHGHVVDLERRSLACTCRACYLLFTGEGAGGGRYRSVPDRVCHDPDRPLTASDWDALGIPVGTAFFFHHSGLDQIVASYPSPAGATECELDLSAWGRLAADRPLCSALRPDVEALFVTRTDGGIETYLIPIDECYALVGRIRLSWSGLDGGQEVRDALASFAADLRGRARLLGTEE